MSLIVPFYFAWVESSQTEFDPTTMNVVQENVFSFHMQHDEGQVPTLDITIQNPRMGLLNPGRKVWAWLSYQSPTMSGIIPIFFGVLVGIPTDLFAELVTLKFIARSMDYIEAKQAVAETMKIVPYYDPIFIDESHRDNPDAILEGWSALYHVDRTSLAVTASDVLEGEDGTITFAEGDAFYDSVHLNLNQAPLANVQVQATVHWTQRSTGYVAGPNVNIQSYTGDTFLSEWPKPGASLGSGWHVEASFVSDVYKVGLTPSVNYSESWSNNDPSAGDCSTASMSQSSSTPALLSPNPLSTVLTVNSQTGDCDAFADPQINTPLSLSVSGMIVPLWVLNCRWNLRYEAKREYEELLVMDVTANTQAILTSPTVEQDTELIKISGADVGNPVLIVEAWSDFAGKSVGLGQFIFPNDPVTPGGLSYQICVTAGVAGTAEPVFSDVPGVITIDNTVHWASLGTSPPTASSNWTQASFVPLGEIINYQPVAFDPASGDLLPTGQSTYYICTTAGETNAVLTEITYIPPVTDNDTPLPAPQHFFYIPGPAFTTVQGAHIGDGSVTWTCLGQQPAFVGIPIGGAPNNVTARSYFPTDRGQQSIQYLIAKARARIRMRSRAVKLEWECPFDAVLGMSCRHNAALYDPRLPGGLAIGKVISYSMSAAGDGKLRGKVEIGVAVGLGGVVASFEGTPDYVNDGYVNLGYQLYDGSQVALLGNDIAYTPPVFAPFDDGLNFPLNSLPGISIISGSSAEQEQAITAAFPEQKYLNQIENPAPLSTNPGGAPADGTTSTISASGGWLLQQIAFAATGMTVTYTMEANPVTYEFLLNPVQNGPFHGAYFVNVTPLEIPEGIDLSAPSSP